MNGEKLVDHFKRLADAPLLAELSAIRDRERWELSRFLAALGEMDRRHLAQRKAFPSAFAYCVKKLALSEDEACRRVRAANACLRFPFILSMIDDGSVSLCAVSTLGPLLKPGTASRRWSGPPGNPFAMSSGSPPSRRPSPP